MRWQFSRFTASALLALLWLATPAVAQNTICPTAPLGTSNNQCASTQFVQNAVAGGSSLVIGSTPISGGANGQILFQNGLVLGEKPTTGTGSVVLGTAPTIASPNLTGTVTGNNTIPLSILAQSPANTMLGNWTGGSANVLANAMPSCPDTGTNHLNYVSGSGITCGTGAGSAITALTGDVTATGPGSVAATLATVNASVGIFGSATQSVQVTLNAKGLATAASNVTITPAFSSLTGQATLAQLPTIGANTVISNWTAGSTTPLANTWPACANDGTHALVYVNGTGLQCATISAGTGSVTNIATNNGVTGGPITTTGTIGLASIAADNLLANSTGSSAPPIATAIGSCSGATNALTYSTSTHAFGCNTITPGTGTVTSVSFTGGLISVATATTTPALTVAGTSGGVPYFSSASTWASSGALTANALVIGGGAGNAPSTTTTGTGVLTALGVNVGSAGAFVVNGGALGTPSSGTLTNTTGFPLANLSGAGTGVLTQLANAVSTAGGSTQTIAAGTLALNTTAIGSGTCGTVQTATATGTATTDVVTASFNADPTATTGYIPATSGMLTIIVYPTSNTFNAKVCNNTSSSITPGGTITLNFRVVR